MVVVEHVGNFNLDGGTKRTGNQDHNTQHGNLIEDAFTAPNGEVI
jgi:hypothetical protein